MPKDINKEEFEVLFPEVGESSTLLVGCRRADYSASMMARAVEDCNAHVLNLNVTGIDSPVADIVVALRIDLRSTDAVTRSLARYGYEVLSVAAPDGDLADGADDDMRRRISELLRYIEI